jgi:hypothetical protein
MRLRRNIALKIALSPDFRLLISGRPKSELKAIFHCFRLFFAAGRLLPSVALADTGRFAAQGAQEI